jgi:hypothetical protein
VALTEKITTHANLRRTVKIIKRSNRMFIKGKCFANFKGELVERERKAHEHYLVKLIIEADN